MKLTTVNAAEYLRSRGHLATGESAHARELSGGVSNVVIRVVRSDGTDLVLKQGCQRLKVAEPWYCSIDRIWREIDVLRCCATLVHGSKTTAHFKPEVPRLLFEDRENYLYAMSAAPANHVAWKHELLSGLARPDIALSCGVMLGTLHAKSWHDLPVHNPLHNHSLFWK